MTKEEMLEIVKEINAQLEDVREKVQQALSVASEEVDPYWCLASANYELNVLQKGLKFYEHDLEERG